MTTIKAVAYISRTTIDFDQSQIDQLLEDSRQFNQQQNVTGVLLYNASFFFQYVEGGVDAVAKVYERIQKATSHEIVLEVYNDTIEQLHFSNWCMGFCALPESFLQKRSQENWLDNVPSIQTKQNESHALAMLMTFWNNMNTNPSTRLG
jgi:hypothetical protein